MIWHGGPGVPVKVLRRHEGMGLIYTLGRLARRAPSGAVLPVAGAFGQLRPISDHVLGQGQGLTCC